MKDKTDYMAECWNIAYSIAKQAHGLYGRDLYRRLYVYCGNGGAWIVADGDKEYGALVTGEAIPRCNTIEQNTAWLVKYLRSAPMYAECQTVPA